MMNGPQYLLGQFVSPALFAAGAAAVAAPILIHLLARRRFKRIRWAAIEFLLQAERKNRRRLRMEEWILLFLRCLALLCIAFLLARPFLAPGTTLAGFGGSRRTERVLVLDDSLSMTYQSASGETSFSRAKAGTKRLADMFRQEAGGESVALWRMTQPNEPVQSGVYLDDRQTVGFLEQIDGMNASQQSVDPGLVVAGLAEFLGRSEEIGGATVYVLSDFQKNQWVRPAQDTATDRQPGLLDPLVEWAGEERGLRLVFINVSEPDPANLALTELRSRQGQLVAGSTGRFTAEIANFSAQPAEALGLRVSVDGVPQAAATLREAPVRQTSSLELELDFPRPGSQAVRLDLAADALPLDNTRHFSAEVLGAIRILIVNGEPSADRYNDETTFLATALKPEGTVFSGNEPVIVDEAEFDSMQLSTFHVVVLANVYRLSDPAVESLERFVRGGGGAIVFLGDQVDADLYNGELFRDGAGILPATLQGVVRAAGESHLVIRDPAHPALRGVAGEDDALGIGQIGFFQYFSCEPWAGSVRSPEDSVRKPAPGGEEKPTTVLAAFDDSEDHPAVLERTVGAGRVVMFTMTADKEWSLWPDHPTFVPVLIEMAQHVARRDERERERRVGEPIELPMDSSLYETDAIVRTPGYPAEAEVTLSASTPEGQDEYRLIWRQTGTAGMYRFLLRRREGGETTKLVAVNVDPQESDLTPATENDLRRAFPRVPFEYFNGIDQLSGSGGEGRTEFWRVFLVAAALFLMTEQSLAWYWGKRR